MPSQLDLDQGGTSREWIRTYMGPSVGWVNVPQQNVFPITAGGTYFLDLSTSLVMVNTTGAVVINLPSCVPSAAGVQAVPGSFAKNPITIVDVGGNASAHPITIQIDSVHNAGQTIMGLASISITINYGGFTLQPIPATATWNSISP